MVGEAHRGGEHATQMPPQLASASIHAGFACATSTSQGPFLSTSVTVRQAAQLPRCNLKTRSQHVFSWWAIVQSSCKVCEFGCHGICTECCLGHKGWSTGLDPSGGVSAPCRVQLTLYSTIFDNMYGIACFVESHVRTNHQPKVST